MMVDLVLFWNQLTGCRATPKQSFIRNLWDQFEADKLTFEMYRSLKFLVTRRSSNTSRRRLIGSSSLTSRLMKPRLKVTSCKRIASVWTWSAPLSTPPKPKCGTA